MNQTITTSTGGSTTWTFLQAVCARCGGYITPFAYWSIIPPKTCTCGMPSVNLGRLQLREATLSDVPRAAWQCPGCQRWYAPHIDSCECTR